MSLLCYLMQYMKFFSNLIKTQNEKYSAFFLKKIITVVEIYVQRSYHWILQT